MGYFGHRITPDGLSEVRVFAPCRQQVALVLLPDERVLPMTADAVGYWQVQLDERLPVGTRYWIEIDGRRYPDIASRRQPDGVHGPSMVENPVAAASDDWRGVSIEDAVIYELHLGTFTAEGTLAAAAERLADLADIGITAIELLPIAAFPGHRNWGYDGVCLFALQVDYGSYADLKAFIERAHQLGMAVLLDVVYNHFGPEGNYSAAYGPYTRQAATPWGAAINFDEAWSHGVRAFYLENARYWLQDIGFDGFRMDAVHAAFDSMPVHILRQMTDLARDIGTAQNRKVLMIAEHLHNDRHVTSPAGFGFQSQWNDDLNHAVYACLSGERRGHLANFGGFDDVVKALRDGFVLDGSRFDRYRCFFTGTDGASTTGAEHIVHVQNHDQVGNRPRGDRMIANLGRAKALLAVTAMMASAFVPMLFMGEEFGATTPFLFFEDFADPDLIDGVRRGRLRDFGADDPAGNESDLPDPHAESTFLASKLRWAERDTPEGRSVLVYHRQLIALKRAGELGPRDRSRLTVTGDAPSRLIRIETRHTLTLLNFSDLPCRAAGPALTDAWQPVLASLPWSGATQPLPPFGAAVLRRVGIPP